MSEYEIWIDGKRRGRVIAYSEADAKAQWVSRGLPVTSELTQRVAAYKVEVDESYQ